MRRLLVLLLIGGSLAGCGTTKWTDTARTATEQLLLTDSMDRAVSKLDFRAIAGKKVFIDESPVKNVVDAPYLISAIRQEVLASGAVLREKRDEADYVMEVRAGAVGTDRHDLLFGMPAITLPAVGTAGVPSQIPEIPLVKRTDQRAVAKIALFVYNRRTGRPLWQSGAVPEESKAKALWVFGAGPFQRGSIYRGTKFAGDHVTIPLIDPAQKDDKSSVAVADEAFFIEPVEPGRDLAAAIPADDGLRMAADPLASFNRFIQACEWDDRIAPASPPGQGPGDPSSGNRGPQRPNGQVPPEAALPPSTTEAGFGNTVPGINLPGQLPFGVNPPWTQDVNRLQSTTSDSRLNPFSAIRR